ncbi:hypothetical protein LUZ60_011486 [Juncus effusus]|nr:hypothetical protein LUZ60_011486 [Juncus effusus]
MENNLSDDQMLAELLEMGFEFTEITNAVESVGTQRDNVLEFLLNPSCKTSKSDKNRRASSLKQPSIRDHISRSGDKNKKPGGSSSVCGNASERESLLQTESEYCQEGNFNNKKLEGTSSFVGNTIERETLQQEASQCCENENKIKHILQKHFGFGILKDFQKEALNAWSNNKDCLVLAATGSGKSLCFQLPALLTEKVVVVISPLISLMHDQCLKLARHGVPACFLGSGQPDSQVEKKAMNGAYKIVYVCPETIVRLMEPLKRLAQNPGIALFAIDEVHCVSKWGHDFRPHYRRLSVLRENFNTSKLKFLEFNIPIMALTATATMPVRDDILKSLKMAKDSKIILTTFFRPNLRFSVKHSRTNASSYLTDFTELISTYTESRALGKRSYENYENATADSDSDNSSESSFGHESLDDEEENLQEENHISSNNGCNSLENSSVKNNLEDELDLQLDVDDFDVSCGEFLETPLHASCSSSSANLEQGPTIVYVPTRKETIKLAQFLSKSGVKAEAYNAKLPKSHLRHVHQEFHDNNLQVVVATIAFGMGIDKSSVRRIIHYGWPQSLEAYYQEAGRAGRDGKLSDCTLFANLLRAPTLLPSKRSEQQTRQSYTMLSDCYRYGMNTATCRAKILVKYFGEEFGPEGCHLCDICEKGPPELQNFKEEALAFLRELKCRIWECSERQNFKVVVSRIREKYQNFATSDRIWWQGLARILENRGYIKEGDSSPRVLIRNPELTDSGIKFLQALESYVEEDQNQTLCTFPDADMVICSSSGYQKSYSTFAEWGRGWADPETRKQRLADIRKNGKAKRKQKEKRKEKSFWKRRHHDTSTVRGRLAEKLTKRKR